MRENMDVRVERLNACCMKPVCVYTALSDRKVMPLFAGTKRLLENDENISARV